MTRRTITASVDTADVEVVKASGWKYGFVFAEGVKALQNRNDAMKAIKELRNENELLQKNMDKYRKRTLELMHKVEQLESEDSEATSGTQN